MTVYVVTAFEDGKIKEQEVHEDFEEAGKRFNRLIDIYGGSNVILASRWIQKPS